MSALAFALRYAAKGWHVLPLTTKGKQPCAQLAPRGVYSATTDAAKLRRWFADDSLNVGLACGPSGLTVVDIDVRNDGHITMEQLVQKHGPLPKTPIACTGGGGWHYLYATPSEQLHGKLGAGVDLLGPGRYIVAAPSTHPSGRAYSWDLNALPSATPLAPLPRWIVDIAKVVEESAPTPRQASELPADVLERASKWLARCDPSLSDGNGSACLMHAASSLTRGFMLTDSDALCLLELEFNPRCTPPWSTYDLVRAVRSTRRPSKKAKPAGHLLSAPRRVA